MTTGRFESTWNCRPEGWDTRYHWTMPHEKACQQDHMERESCPFHDLRAEGCFQPEHGAGDSYRNVVVPQKLTERPAGKRMKTSPNPGRHLGVGGLRLPIDTDASAVPQKLARSVSTKPWTRTAPTGTTFGKLKGLPLPPPPPEAPAAHDNGNKAPFRAGTGTWNTNVVHPPDPYDDSRASRPVFRLAAGYREPLFSRPEPDQGAAPLPRSRSVRPSLPRPAFDVRKPLNGTFGFYPEYVSDPWSQGSLKCERRPIFTYHAQSKRSMPILVPWTTGMTTAEPERSR